MKYWKYSVCWPLWETAAYKWLLYITFTEYLWTLYILYLLQDKQNEPKYLIMLSGKHLCKGEDTGQLSVLDKHKAEF